MITKVLGQLGFIDTTIDDGRIFEFKRDYESTKEFVRSSIYWMVRSDAVDDLVQETYFKAWRNYGRFNQDSSFKTWIYRIAKNTVYDYFRANKKKQSIEYDIEKQGIEAGYEMKDLISKGLNLLSDKHREAFVLFYKQGLSKSEIAEILGVSEGTVKSRVHYAKEDFITFLSENGVVNE